MLHRRFGTRLSGAERTRRAQEHYDRLRSVMPIDVVKAKPRAGASPGKLAIIGAGYAGCAAAYVAHQLGFDVTVYDAIGTPGGRVSSSTLVVPGRILETGAELIGLNHPAWLTLAATAGFALGVVTPDDDYAGAFLNSPLTIGGVPYDPAAQSQLYDGMQSVFSSWVDQSAIVTMPLAPWQTPDAPALDAQNLGANIPVNTPANVVNAIGMEFEFNNTTPIGEQSWLANLAQIQAGGGQGFFENTEVFRCTAGNQQLAYWLLCDLAIVKQTVTAIETSSGDIKLTFQTGETAGPYDYVIVATSVAIWPFITVDDKPFPYDTINNGPAIKYLAPVEQRFWITESLAPSGMSDVLGMTWEGTDNQADTAAYDLTVFSGGTAAQNAIDNDGKDAYFAPLISELYPGFSTQGGTFVNSPGNSAILTGYSCPAPGQVVGAQQSYPTPYNERLFVAGEHTSPAWFGYMEGALESGIMAAVRVALSASVDLPAEWGGMAAL